MINPFIYTLINESGLTSSNHNFKNRNKFPKCWFFILYCACVHIFVFRMIFIQLSLYNAANGFPHLLHGDKFICWFWFRLIWLCRRAVFSPCIIYGSFNLMNKQYNIQRSGNSREPCSPTLSEQRYSESSVVCKRKVRLRWDSSCHTHDFV